MAGNMAVVSVREARVTVCVFSSKELLFRDRRFRLYTRRL
jgi:hypothetical protein